MSDRLLGKFSNEFYERFEIYLGDSGFFFKGDETDWEPEPIPGEFLFSSGEIDQVKAIVPFVDHRFIADAVENERVRRENNPRTYVEQQPSRSLPTKKAIAAHWNNYDTIKQGLINKCIDTAASYNAEARKVSSEQFRAIDLPVSLDSMECAE